ncbi:MAG: nucleoside triphosphate pyrophosphohydrolase [Candidatus Heimdallarchaeota archaeon]|nr:nucleoside triphosphate pyrophosphohydrolase [Candidatus Heimdallarchaeota archaeon]
MTSIYFDKLVRDKIPEIIKNDGKIVELRVAKNDEEFMQYLSKKLVEEASEYSKDHDINELIDILEVLLEIAKVKNTTFNELNALRHKKKLERGGFSKKIILLVVKE